MGGLADIFNILEKQEITITGSYQNDSTDANVALVLLTMIMKIGYGYQKGQGTYKFFK